MKERPDARVAQWDCSLKGVWQLAPHGHSDLCICCGIVPAPLALLPTKVLPAAIEKAPNVADFTSTEA